MSKSLVSILMPLYNERPFLRRIVEQVLSAPLPSECMLELIIVDDASTDGSSKLADNLANEHPKKIKVFHQDQNKGKGAALAKAIELMCGDIAIFQDADLEYDPSDYGRLIKPILDGHADVVFGSRFLGTANRRVLNYHHALGNLLLTHLSNATTGLNLTDMETCYKAFRADILRTIPIRSNRFGIEPEITAKVAKRSCTVYEVPISYHGRTYLEGKKITWRDGIEALGVIGKYWLVDDCFDDRYGHEVLNSLTEARRFSKWSVKVIEPWLGNRILEIGSGIANISRQLPMRELLTLSDRDPEYLKLLQQAFEYYDGVEVIELDITKDEHFERLEKRFDTIVCLNVLEHIQDDVSALGRMAQLLQPGGRLILQVPQYQFLYSPMDKDLGHYRRYETQELGKKLSDAGLQVEIMKNFNSLGTLGWLVNSRIMGKKDLGKLKLKIYDMLVPALSRIEKVLDLPGLSIVAVGKKTL